MPYSCTSPTATSEEDWINEVLLFSPLDLTTSNDAKSSLSSPEFGPTTNHGTEPEYEDLFSTISSNQTSATTPENPRESGKHHLLDSVSVKLQRLKEQNCLTPKALESVFNTQDVLADSGDWQTETAKHHKTRRSRASVSGHHDNHNLAHNSAKACTKKHASLSSSLSSSSSLSASASAAIASASAATSTSGHGCRKRKNSRAKAPKSAHPHAAAAAHFQHHHTNSPPYMSRRASVTSINKHMPEPVSMSSSGYVTPSFPESWFAPTTPYVPSQGACSPNFETAYNPVASLFDQTAAYLPPITDVPDSIDDNISSSSPVSETSNFFFASAPPSTAAPLFLGSEITTPTTKDRLDSIAVQEALAYIDFLQQENMLQQASLEGTM